MDEEGMLIDIADARGQGAANSCLMAALVATFVSKGLLAREDAATLTGIAQIALDGLPDLSEDARELANSALRGFARSWGKLVTSN
jgi:hypothetical protein